MPWDWVLTNNWQRHQPERKGVGMSIEPWSFGNNYSLYKKSYPSIGSQMKGVLTTMAGSSADVERSMGLKKNRYA